MCRRSLKWKKVMMLVKMINMECFLEFLTTSGRRHKRQGETSLFQNYLRNFSRHFTALGIASHFSAIKVSVMERALQKILQYIPVYVFFLLSTTSSWVSCSSSLTWWNGDKGVHYVTAQWLLVLRAGRYYFPVRNLVQRHLWSCAGGRGDA
jgi:hypothetical protein